MRCFLSFCCMAIAPAFCIAAEPQGIVITHSPTKTKAYIGSPSIVKLPDGELLASHDFFGPGTNFDTSEVFASSDAGKTWKLRATLKNQWWSTLFTHGNAVYIIGTTKEYGQTVIRRSTDVGKTWTEPKDAESGLLLADGQYHCAPVPIVLHKGRLWRAMEQFTGPKWGAFQAFVMSVPEDADLLKAKNWTSTNKLDRNLKWLNGGFQAWLEGNIVPTPDGKLVNILRVQQPEHNELAAIVRIIDEKTIAFDPEKDFITFPGGAKKFQIRLDPKSKTYYALASTIPEKYRVENLKPGSIRNTLSLMRSADLVKWEEVRVLIQDDEVKTSGFQYPDWLFDGDDIIAAVRTAFPEKDGTKAHNAHDANYLTFHRFAHFRK